MTTAKVDIERTYEATEKELKAVDTIEEIHKTLEAMNSWQRGLDENTGITALCSVVVAIFSVLCFFALLGLSHR